MTISLVTPPPADAAAVLASLLLQEALREICAQRPGWQCVVIPAMPLPGILSPLKRSRFVKAVTAANPGLVVYASPANLLPLRGIPCLALVGRRLTGSPDGALRKKMQALAAVITDSDVLRQDITDYSGMAPAKVHVLPLALACPPAAGPHDIRERFTAGGEYFFAASEISASGDWEELLRAFSAFKKWQRSGLKLVLAGEVADGYEALFNEKLGSYKYRQDVVHLAGTDAGTRAALVSAAFALLAPARTFNGRADITHAHRAGVPVITEDSPMARALCGEAALYAAPGSREALSGHMIAVYKNETLYGQLSAAGKDIGGLASRAVMLDKLNDVLHAAAKHELN